jgi:ubiquinone/menaquinone biosynthesis C-methylase UbiE
VSGVTASLSPGRLTIMGRFGTGALLQVDIASQHARARVRGLMPVEGDLGFRRRCETIVEFLDAQPGELILDCGCGYGFTLRVLRELTAARLIGLDLQRARVEHARERLGAACAFVQGSALRLPFADASFDKAVSSEVLEHLPDDRAALAELYRVLRPGGTLVVTVPSARYPFGWDPINYLLERTTGRHIGGERTFSGIWYGHRRLYTTERLRELIERAGFAVEEVRGLTHYVPPFSHLVMYGILKPLLLSGKLPGGLTRAGDRCGAPEGRTPRGVVGLGGRILNAIDRRNDDPRLAERVDSFVALAVRARKPR